MIQRPSKFPYLLFTALLCLDITTFLVEKTGSTHAAASGREFALAILTQPWLWLVLSLKLLQLFTWTRILATIDISLAFPLTGLAYPLTMLAAVVLLKEHLDWQVWLGGILITLGAAVLGQGEHPPAIAQPQQP
jgi:drug/metabolite transporter (DMT)-like permease